LCNTYISKPTTTATAETVAAAMVEADAAAAGAGVGAFGKFAGAGAGAFGFFFFAFVASRLSLQSCVAQQSCATPSAVVPDVHDAVGTHPPATFFPFKY